MISTIIAASIRSCRFQPGTPQCGSCLVWIARAWGPMILQRATFLSAHPGAGRADREPPAARGAGVRRVRSSRHERAGVAGLLRWSSLRRVRRCLPLLRRDGTPRGRARATRAAEAPKARCVRHDPARPVGFRASMDADGGGDHRLTRPAALVGGAPRRPWRLAHVAGSAGPVRAHRAGATHDPPRRCAIAGSVRIERTTNAAAARERPAMEFMPWRRHIGGSALGRGGVGRRR